MAEPYPESIPDIEITARETLSDGFYKLEKVTFRQRDADGSEQTLDREVLHNGPGAAVLPYDRARGAVLLVRQLRIAAALNGDIPFLVEACAGVVDPGDQATDTVAKEALQELGYRLHDVRKVFELYTSPGGSAEKLHLFMAAYTPGDRVSDGGGLPAEGEQIRVLEVPLDRAWEMVQSGRIIDAKTVLLLQHLRLLEQAVGG
ncbi:NUDIX domain-containing protein [Lichenicola sp.]|uniref:NUDIX domain-containing protein n=1 Tax=Lichenicola sp. TaxID=2804529 RepID=UPI003AFF8D0C